MTDATRPTARVAAILGATGRLGPALARALAAAGWSVRGLSRRDPLPGEHRAFDGFERADRGDVDALRRMVDGATLVVDALGHDLARVDALLEAIDAADSPPSHLIALSSIAELGPEAFGAAEDAPRAPRDARGRSMLAARRRAEEGFGGATHVLVLPRLVAEVDHGRREQPYLDAAGAGTALVAGSGAQAQVMAPVEGVAAVIRALAESPERVRPGVLHVGPPSATRVRDFVTALLEGARLEARLARHPDSRWRGPHGGAPEPHDCRLLQASIPEILWPDPLEVARRAGAWLVANPASGRSRPLVRAAHRSYRQRATVDVHDVRRDVHPDPPTDALDTVASWLSRSCYVDVGRPCNSACIYCAVPPHADTQGFAPLQRLDEAIDAGVTASCERAILIGGEPTIYPELDELLERLRAAGLVGGHVVMTNGIQLADDAAIDRLVDGGVRTIHLSIDTTEEAIYDRISRSPGRFGRQMEALRNVLRRPDLNVYVYSAATRLNEAGLDALSAGIAEEARAAGVAPPPHLIAFVKPIGDARTHAEMLLLSPTERAEIGRRLVASAAAHGVDVGLRNLQACLAPELVGRLVDYYVGDASVDVRTGEQKTYVHHTEYYAYVDGCEGCTHRAICPGVYRDELGRYGAGAFRAIRSPAPPARGC